MKVTICFFAAIFLFATTNIIAQTMRINFDKEKAGETPKGFTTALTGGGRPASGSSKDDTATNKGNVLPDRCG
jgi:hypothetical protein